MFPFLHHFSTSQTFFWGKHVCNLFWRSMSRVSSISMLSSVYCSVSNRFNFLKNDLLVGRDVVVGPWSLEKEWIVFSSKSSELEVDGRIRNQGSPLLHYWMLFTYYQNNCRSSRYKNVYSSLIIYTSNLYLFFSQAFNDNFSSIYTVTNRTSTSSCLNSTEALIWNNWWRQSVRIDIFFLSI